MNRSLVSAGQNARVKTLEKLQNHLGVVAPIAQAQNPFELLVSIMLSAQARDAQVEGVMASLFQKRHGPEALSGMSLEACEMHLKPLGLYRHKARYLLQIAQLWPLLSKEPDFWTRESLMRLPGVGRKSANLVLSLLFQHPTLAVDTHVFRIARRLGWSQGKTPLEVELDLEAQLPPEWLWRLNSLWVRHGRRWCTARFPKCSACPIMEACDFGKASFRL